MKKIIGYGVLIMWCITSTQQVFGQGITDAFDKKLKTLRMILPVVPTDDYYDVCTNGQVFSLGFENLAVQYGGAYTTEEAFEGDTSSKSHILSILVDAKNLESENLVIRAVRDPKYDLSEFVQFKEVSLYYKTYHLVTKKAPKEELRVLVLYARPMKFM